MARHRGRFKWKRYSAYNGNLRVYWQGKDRPSEHRLTHSRLHSDDGTFIDVFGDLHRGNQTLTMRFPHVDVRVGELWEE